MKLHWAKITDCLRRNYISTDLRPFFILLTFLLIIPLYSSAQSRQELEKQRVQLQKEIKEINTLLFKSQKKEKTLLSDLSDLINRIGVRTKLINTINEETKQLSKEIAEMRRRLGF